MQQAGYLASRSRHPAALGTVVILHIAVVAALLAFAPTLVERGADVLKLLPIAIDPSPPPRPVERVVAPRADPAPAPRPDTSRAPIDIGPTDWTTLQPLHPIEFPPVGGGGMAPPADTFPPVVIDAAIDPRYARDLQPPYPPALVRQEIEGVVVVRVAIGADGRVTGIEQVRSDDPGLFAATRDWAFRHWRFRPATRDGAALASVKTMTVRFRVER